MPVKRQRTLTSFVPSKIQKIEDARNEPTTKTSPYERIVLPGASVIYARDVFSAVECDSLFHKLKSLECWAQRKIMIFGKMRNENRKTAVFTLPSLFVSDEEVAKKTDLITYRYSGRDNRGALAPECVIEIHRRVEEWGRDTAGIVGQSSGAQLFNYVLGNYYADGTENIGMHSDDERGLEGPILSVSFGSPRFFDFHERGKSNGGHKVRLTLEPGSILLMSGDTQKNYKHGVPIQKKIKDARINLTFRHVVKPK